MNFIKQISVVALFCCGVVAPNALGGSLTVNDGVEESGYVPFHFYYLDNAQCRSQVIYPAEQLTSMVGSSIREIEFYLTEEGFTDSWSAPDMRLSLATTTQSTYSIVEYSYTEFLDVPFSVAYAGPMSGEEGGRQLKFVLTAPFTYTGQNLVLQISQGEIGSDWPHAYFLGVAPGENTAAYTTMGNSIYPSDFLPKTTFTYGEAVDYEATVSPQSLTIPTIMLGNTASASVTVSNTGVQSLNVTMTGVTAPFSATLPATTIEGGQSMSIPVTFAPTAAGTFTTQMTLDLGEAGTFTVDITGNAMETPEGYTAAFTGPDQTLPAGWTGWDIIDEYDFDIYEYVFSEAKESTYYFRLKNVDGTPYIGIDEENPIREYPYHHTVYAISPAVKGNVLLNLTYLGTYANDVKVYEATQLADGTWSISADPLPMSWVTNNEEGWNLMIGTMAEPTHMAILLSNAGIASFAADELAEEIAPTYSAEVSPETINFGTVRAGQTATTELSVLNTGSMPFEITATCADTDLTAALSATTVAAGETVTVTVTYAPQAAGPLSTELTLDMGDAGTVSVPVTATAVDAEIGAEFTLDGITYVVLTRGTVGVSSVSSDITECTIPALVENEEGMAFDVVSIEREAFYFSNVTNVTLPETITTIGYGAFRQSPLAQINLPASVTAIGDFAFRATELTAVIIPDGVTTLGSSVFAMCENLTDVTLPQNLTSIGSGAFYKAGITSIDIPTGCTSIGMEAFESCTALTEVNLPEGLTEISSMLFLGCSSLTEIVLPASLTKIDSQAFEECSLLSLNLPAGVTDIASSTFNGTPIALITVANGNTAFKVADGMLYSADGTLLYLCPRSGMTETVEVAEGTRGIIGGAFYEAEVSNVVLPESMTGIDEYAFCLSALQEINLPASIFIIGEQAFAGTELTTVQLPESLEEISDGLFAACHSLKSVTIPASVTLVGNRAFYDCTALKEIIAQGETPAEFDAWDSYSSPFLNVDCDAVTLYCPDGEDILAVYRNSEWSDFFTNIKNISDRPMDALDELLGSEINVSGGNNITVMLGENKADVAVYTVSGLLIRFMANVSGTIKLSDLTPGLYLVNVAGTTYKLTVN